MAELLGPGFIDTVFKELVTKKLTMQGNIEFDANTRLLKWVDVLLRGGSSGVTVYDSTLSTVRDLSGRTITGSRAGAYGLRIGHSSSYLDLSYIAAANRLIKARVTSDTPTKNPAVDVPDAWLKVTDENNNVRYIPIYT